MAQSVERRIGSAEVPGPIPGASFPNAREMAYFRRFPGFLFSFFRLPDHIPAQVDQNIP